VLRVEGGLFLFLGGIDGSAIYFQSNEDPRTSQRDCECEELAVLESYGQAVIVSICTLNHQLCSMLMFGKSRDLQIFSSPAAMIRGEAGVRDRIRSRLGEQNENSLMQLLFKVPTSSYKH
jgi:hypothetical protein